MSTDNQILTELQEIRKLLTPAPAPVPPTGFLNEFKYFLSQYKVLGLAVAFILGLYLGALVASLVTNIVMPIFTYIPGMEGIAWDAISIGNFTIGLFINDLITFIIIAFTIFVLVKVATKLGID